MISDDDLIARAASLVDPRILSRNADAGKVGSALLTKDGHVYVGTNVETDCDMGFCAEQNAMGTMISAGEQDVDVIVAVNKEGKVIPPCGRCREFIYQASGYNENTRVILRGGRSKTIQELLPEHWKTDTSKRGT